MYWQAKDNRLTVSGPFEKKSNKALTTSTLLQLIAELGGEVEVGMAWVACVSPGGGGGG